MGQFDNDTAAYVNTLRENNRTKSGMQWVNGASQDELRSAADNPSHAYSEFAQGKIRNQLYNEAQDQGVYDTLADDLNETTVRARRGSDINAYTLKKGDTLWDIAQALGTTVQELRKRNPNFRGRIGDKVYMTKGAQASTVDSYFKKKAAKRAQAKKRAAERERNEYIQANPIRSKAPASIRLDVPDTKIMSDLTLR